MIRAATRAFVGGMEDAGVVLLLVLMAGCLASVLAGMVAVSPAAAVPVACFAAAAGWGLAAPRFRRGRWLPLAAVPAANAALLLSGATTGSLLSLRSDLLSMSPRLLDADHASGRLAGPIAVLVVSWATPLIAARAVRLRRRAADAWIPMGALLIGAMVVREHRDLVPLVAFAAAALLLTLAMTSAARRRRWARSRMVEGQGVSVAMARRGWAATVATVLVAWALTSIAVGAPLQDAWRAAGQWWTEQRAPSFGFRPGASFDREFAISAQFNPTMEEVAVVSGSRTAGYLRIVTHDTYTGVGWTQGGQRVAHVGGGDPLLTDASLEVATDTGGAAPTIVTITLDRDVSAILLPVQPVSVSPPSTVTRSAAGPFLVSVEVPDQSAGDSYQVTSLSEAASAEGLAGAGELYPSSLAPYLALEGVSQRTRDLAIRLTAAKSTPYHRAVALVEYLRGADPRYATRSELPPPGSDRDSVDFFLFDARGRVGFCEQFASAMVLLARSAGIPARLARGYVGGDPRESGAFQVRHRNGHAWAELYFPGHGWQVFEATPAVPRVGRGERPISSREPAESQPASPSASPSVPVERSPESSAGSGSGEDWAIAGLAGVAVVAAVAVLGLAWRLRRGRHRARRPAPPPDLLWERLARGARRAGLVRRPSQTAYEFAGWMRHVLPELDPEISLLASAYVAERYAPPGARRSPVHDLPDAWRRVRSGLLRFRIRRRLRWLARR